MDLFLNFGSAVVKSRRMLDMNSLDLFALTCEHRSSETSRKRNTIDGKQYLYPVAIRFFSTSKVNTLCPPVSNPQTVVLVRAAYNL